MVIAIDGFSSSGKSTMAKQLARKIGFTYIDSGAMYRATTLYALRHGLINPDRSVRTDELVARLPNIHISFERDEQGLPITMLNGENVEKEIRSMTVSNAVSPVSAIAAVRRYLTAQQQLMGSDTDIVMDGRDIGTTVFPQAELKFFIDASPEVRAKRRFKELQEKGMPAKYEDVLDNIKTRDYIDRTREESPLRKADDAIVVNNDNLTLEQQLQLLIDTFNERRAK